MENIIEKEYQKLEKEYQKIIKNFKMGIITRKECKEKTEIIEYKMLDLEYVIGTY